MKLSNYYYNCFLVLAQFQQTGPATLQELRAAEGEADVCNRGDGGLWTGVRSFGGCRNLKITNIQIRGLFSKNRVSRVLVLMHTCTHLCGTSVPVCL